MDDTPNKPGDDKDEQQAVKNQSKTSPDKYPADDGGKPDYGSPHHRPDE